MSSEYTVPPEWFVHAFIATADSRAEQLDQADAGWQALIKNGVLRNDHGKHAAVAVLVIPLDRRPFSEVSGA